jgi:hypothetical protein
MRRHRDVTTTWSHVIRRRTDTTSSRRDDTASRQWHGFNWCCCPGSLVAFVGGAGDIAVDNAKVVILSCPRCAHCLQRHRVDLYNVVSPAKPTSSLSPALSCSSASFIILVVFAVLILIILVILVISIILLVRVL